jgi:hypothetical protein
MKKIRKIKMGLFNSKNKWARRGRNLAHFLMSLIFYICAYIFYGIAVIIKCLIRFIFLGTNWLFFAKSNSNRNESRKKIKKDKQISVVLPDRFSRLQTLMAQLKNKPIKDNLAVGDIIDLTDGCSESDLIRIVEEAEKIASFRRTNGQKNIASLICEADFLSALKK